MFVAVQNRSGNDYTDHEIAAHGDWTPPEKPTAAAPVLTDAGEDAESAAEENPLSGPDTRNLIYRFWKLRRTKRRQVMITLGTIDVDETITNEPTRYRAASRNVIWFTSKSIGQAQPAVSHAHHGWRIAIATPARISESRETEEPPTSTFVGRLVNIDPIAASSALKIGRPVVCDAQSPVGVPAAAESRD